MESVVEKLSMEQDKKRHNELIGVRCCMDQFQKVFSFMRCSLCMKVCPPECKSCARSGHLVCNECFDRVKLCPFVKKVGKDGTKAFCFAKLETLRFRLYEQLYRAMDVVLSCSFLDYGCQEMLREDELIKHQALCKFRPDFACIITGCNVTKVTGPMLIDHLAKSHGTLIVHSQHESLTIKFKNAPATPGEFKIWAPVVFDCYEHTFLLTVRMDCLIENMVQLRFYMLEDEGSCQKFQIHAQLKDVNKIGKSFGLWSEIPGKLSQMNMNTLELSESEIADSHGFCMELQQFLDNFVFDGPVGTNTQLMSMEVGIDMIQKEEE